MRCTLAGTTDKSDEHIPLQQTGFTILQCCHCRLWVFTPTLFTLTSKEAV